MKELNSVDLYSERAKRAHFPVQYIFTFFDTEILTF